MTQLNDPRWPLEATPDPFFYGWRPVVRTRDDGTTYLENVPLTQQDVLHPQEGDVIVQNTAHDRDTLYLSDVFRNRLLHDPSALVLHDAGVDLGLLGIAMICPDICVVFGVRNRDLARGSFDVVNEAARPMLVVEVVSPSTRANDFGDKMTYYHQALVPVYVIVDRRDLQGPVTLLGYTLGPDGYEVLEPDERGRLWLAAVGLWLGTGENRVVCYDGDKEVGDYNEVTSRLIAAEAKSLQDKQAREAAEAARIAAEAKSLQDKQAREAAEAARIAAEAKSLEDKQAREAAEAARIAAEAKNREDNLALEAIAAKLAQEKQAREAAEARLAELLAQFAERQPPIS